MNGTRVGVVGDKREVVASAIEAAGGRPLVDGPLARAACVVAVGEAALHSLVPDSPAPVLPVAAGDGVNSVSVETLQDILPALLDAEWTTVEHPVVAVDGLDERVYALTDVTLVTAEPARISEYTVASGTAQVARVRADGIVVATPAGSHGYARAAGGPLLAPETDVCAVVPIAPFAIGADHWVLPLTDVRLTVERDDAAVELLVDGRRVGAVSPGVSLRLEPGGVVETVRVGSGDWKNSNGCTTGQ